MTSVIILDGLCEDEICKIASVELSLPILVVILRDFL